jgi:hypothetical protein
MLFVCLLTAFSVMTMFDAIAAFEHFPLARGEGGQRLVAAAPGEQLGDDLGVHRHAARGDLAHRVDELLDVEHAVLQQVPDATGAIGKQFAGVELLDVLRQDEHRQPGHLRTSLDGGA